MIHRAKKSLGQNFLINPKVAERIALEADISKNDTVLEIGPGTGNLTKYLLTRAKKVIAIEKDDNLADNLEKKFKKEIENKKLVLIKEDILKFNFSQKYKIVANIPYNITGAILKKFLTEKNKPESMTLMIQKEVADRILARDGKESLLSISVKAYGKPEILFRVSRGNFYPIPNVDSAVIGIKNISRKIFTDNNIEEGDFWEIVRAGFAHKRKKLSSNLKILPKYNKNSSLNLEKTLENKRPEELSLSDWVELVKRT
jgi:16S rRNA (adenine1518-N6/adenine1519-N6)-dimethyltransferase